MSWFDTTSITKFAKSALKEAQKTIDKALDINDDEEEIADGKSQKLIEPEESNTMSVVDSSVWGSFSGSYFDIGSKLPQSEDVVLRNEGGGGGGGVRKSRSNRNSNRLSIVSNDSLSVSEGNGKKSSESVEVLGPSATTSPEEDDFDPSISIGSPVPDSFTESVEVIDSLASPSSVDVITDPELVAGSPTNVPTYCTPNRSDSLGKPFNDISPDSVEVIGMDGAEEEGCSLADSFTSMSVSESTGTTMLSVFSSSHFSNQQAFESSKSVQHFQSSESTPDVLVKLSHSLHSQGSCDLLSASADWTETSEMDDNSKCISTSQNGSPIKRAVGNQKLDVDRISNSSLLSTSQESDSKTVVPFDSSCENSFVEDNSVSNNDNKQTTCSSIYMKDLIADAIADNLTRETSPTLSEKSRSDLVKIESEQTSGHTSGDELETTTSSDIEIISRHSPNGDSSSTASRYSPTKMLANRSRTSLVSVDISSKTSLTAKIKGHRREPSEASSEDNFSEADKLTRKINELTEILETRETKLLELSKLNMELQEKNASYKKQFEALTTVDETEKDELIKELREEGEKLSKIQFKQSTLIKTLRKQEQQHQAVIQQYKKQVETLTNDLELTKKKLTSREDDEKSKADTISLLTAKVNRQDKEIANLMDQLEKAVIKAEQMLLNFGTLEVDLENKRKEVVKLETEFKKLKEESEIKDKTYEKYKNQDQLHQSIVKSLKMQVEELRVQIKSNESRYAERDRMLREENRSLLRRVDEAESRNEQLSQSVSTSTRPLLRQLEALQSSLTNQRDSWQAREAKLLQQYDEAQARLAELLQKEKLWKQETLEMRSKITHLDQQLIELRQILTSESNEKLAFAQKLTSCEEALKREKSEFELINSVLKTENEELQKKLTIVQSELTAAVAESEKTGRNLLCSLPDHKDGDSSPTLSFGRASLSESLSQIGEDAFETNSITGRFGNVYDSVRVSGSSLLENLQAQLKMREGEVVNLQWELQRRDKERTALRSEIAMLTLKMDEQQQQVNESRQLAETLDALQRNYDALLQIHGEKVEQLEELTLDLQDVKDMYKAQIDQLLNSKPNHSHLDPPG